MGQLNLRGIDEELIKQIKATAASEGQTIPAFVAGVLVRDRQRGGWSAGPGRDSVREEAVKKIKTPNLAAALESEGATAEKLGLRARESASVRVEPVKMAGCKCGGFGVTVVNGQKRCAACGRAVGD